MRALVLVIDSFGIGEAPDAADFGDAGANTALHICEQVSPVRWNNLEALGLGNASELLGKPLPGCPAVGKPSASFGVMQALSPGKDTTTGHWELAGIHLDKAFRTFPAKYPSFPAELTEALEKRSGRRILGNRAASGTVIIQELGEEHIQSGALICYTSADSVFQIAAHEDVVPLQELYDICQAARELCDDYSVARVIARPFTGAPGEFTRSKNRRDFSLPLPEPTILDHLHTRGVRTVGIGKIGDIFNESGLEESYHDKGNPACLDRTLSLLGERRDGKAFIFVNLVDTDMIYGHRRDPQGYHDAVAQIDSVLPEIIAELENDDLLIVTADHGCDPTFTGTDHTREYVPVLMYHKGNSGRSLGIREGLFDCARTLSEYFQVEPYQRGQSMLGGY
jgi:phosphopentomutase